MRLSMSLAAAMLTFAAAAVAQGSETADVSVELSSFAFTPKVLTLDHGRAYALHLSNSAKGGHDFVAKEFFAAATIAPEDKAKVDAKGGVDMPGRQTTVIHLTAPANPGTYRVHCSHFMHESFGMVGEIDVK